MSDDVSPKNEEEARKNYEESLQQHRESCENYYQKEQKRQRKILLFTIIMLPFAYIFTAFFCVFLKITPFYSRFSAYWDFFAGDSGWTFFILLIGLSIISGYLFYRAKGVALALLNFILAPFAAFILTTDLLIVLSEWIRRKRFERLSPEEQERIYELNLSLDYKYSSRGP